MTTARLQIILPIVTSIILVVAGCGGTATAPQVGDKAPNFTLENIDGESVSLSDFRGKPVIIAFHKRHGCPGCQKQTPYLQAISDERGDTELAVLTIYRGDDLSEVRNYVTSQGYALLALADPNDEVGGKKYGFSAGAPINVFVDASGIIRAKKIGPLESKEEIEGILDSE